MRGDAIHALRQACEGSQNTRVKLYLHPRDGRLINLKPVPVSGKERFNAIRALLEGSLLVELDQLVMASRLGSERWITALCDKNWIEMLFEAAKTLGITLEGIWPAQVLFDSASAFNPDGQGGLSELAVIDLVWPPKSEFNDSTTINEPGLNLLEAMILRKEDATWVSVTDGSLQWWRRLDLLLAHARWAIGHAPEGALRRPLLIGIILLSFLGISLQIDTWMLQHRVEQSEVRLEKLFRETMPAQTVMVDPVLQMQRALEKRSQSPSLDPKEAIDPLSGFLLIQRSLSRVAGVAAGDAVQQIEWVTDPSGSLLSLRWNQSIVDQQSLRPIIQEMASKTGLSVQWGSPQEGLVQLRFRPG